MRAQTERARPAAAAGGRRGLRGAARHRRLLVLHRVAAAASGPAAGTACCMGRLGIVGMLCVAAPLGPRSPTRCRTATRRSRSRRCYYAIPVAAGAMLVRFVLRSRAALLLRRCSSRRWPACCWATRSPSASSRWWARGGRLAHQRAPRTGRASSGAGLATGAVALVLCLVFFSWRAARAWARAGGERARSRSCGRLVARARRW